MSNTLQEFAAAINKLAEAEGAVEAGEEYCVAEAWTNAFVDGATPEEAWAEEKSYAAADMDSPA